MNDAAEDKVYIEAMAEMLDRSVHTIRQWLREKEREPGNPVNLPDSLVPSREGGRQKIYWIYGQVDGMRAFADERESRRGWQGQAAS